MRAMRRPRALATSLLALVLAASACTGDDGGGEPESQEPDPQDAATLLASGLTARDL